MRYFFLVIISIITVVITWINVKLYSENYSPLAKRADIIRQLNFLESDLKNNHLGIQMQGSFLKAMFLLMLCMVCRGANLDFPILNPNPNPN